MEARRVKISYTIDGYNKFVFGTILFQNEDFVKVHSDRGDAIQIARRNIDEIIELGGDRNA